MKSVILSLQFLSVSLVGSVAFANQCPDLSGSFKCMIASDTLDVEAYEQGGAWHYEGDQFSHLGPIIADNIEHFVPGFETMPDFYNRYKAYCDNGSLIVLHKTRVAADPNSSDPIYSQAHEYGGKEIYSLTSRGGFKAELYSWGDSPQRSPKEINWDQDTKGRKVSKEASFRCRRLP